jgi:hypothetical protein
MSFEFLESSMTCIKNGGIMNITNQPEHSRGRRVNEYPELHVGFPERNDASNPIDEMERVHVDLETLDISRASSIDMGRALTSPGTSNLRR